MMPTADTLVIDDLWQAIQPLLPTPPRRYDGRPRIDDRACLTGIVYQLRTGVPWRLLPTRQLGCATGSVPGRTPALDPGFVALNRNELPVRARSGGELAERVRRAEDYAVLGARVVVELHTESHASKPSTRPWPPSEHPSPRQLAIDGGFTVDNGPSDTQGRRWPLSGRFAQRWRGRVTPQQAPLTRRRVLRAR
jgi:transposase